MAGGVDSEMASDVASSPSRSPERRPSQAKLERRPSQAKLERRSSSASFERQTSTSVSEQLAKDAGQDGKDFQYVHELTPDEIELGFMKGIKEIGLYLIFLALFSIILVANSVTEAYPYAAAMRNVVSGNPPGHITDILNQADFWDYMEGTFAPAVWVDQDMNGELLSTDNWGYMLGVNKLIGSIRLRQWRVKVSDSVCSVPDGLQIPIMYGNDTTPYIDHCYPEMDLYYWVGRESDKPYGPDNKFKSEMILTEGRFKPMFVENLPSNLRFSDALARIKQLREDEWTDMHTRSVDIFFTTYNVAVEMFCAVHIEFEFLHTGGIGVKTKFRTVNLLRHLLVMTRATADFPPHSYSYGVLTVEFVFYAMVLHLIFQEREMMKEMGQKAYFKNAWRWVDVINYAIFIVMIVFKFAVIVALTTINFKPTPDEYVHFTGVAWLVYQVQNWSALNCVLSFIKLFKYLKVSPRLSQLTATLEAAAPELGSFLIMFAIVFTAYSQAFYLAFGMDIEDFSTPSMSMFSLIMVTLGVFDYAGLRSNNQYLGPFLFFGYIFTIFFVLLNMFLAILGDAHAKVKEASAMADDKFSKTLRAGITSRMAAIAGEKDVVAEEDAAVDLAQQLDAEEEKGIIEQAELAFMIDAKKEELERILGSAEVDNIIAEFDVDGDGRLDSEEAKALLALLEHRALHADDDEDQKREEEKLQQAADSVRDVTDSLREEEDDDWMEDVITFDPISAKAFDLKLVNVEAEQKSISQEIEQRQKQVEEQVSALIDAVIAMGNKVSYRY